MAKVKHTKNELKAQREALRRYERFLPMLQLKKQQLQAEVQAATAQITEKQNAESERRGQLEHWIALFSEDAGIENFISLRSVSTTEGNIAGVVIPILENVEFAKEQPDLFATPSWVDDGMEVLEVLIRLQTERTILEEQRRRIGEELRVTSQRVNLFEKVKIPEARENIRVIKIFLGDEQTAAVARGKLAKRRAETYHAAKEAAPAQDSSL